MTLESSSELDPVGCHPNLGKPRLIEPTPIENESWMVLVLSAGWDIKPPYGALKICKTHPFSSPSS